MTQGVRGQRLNRDRNVLKVFRAPLRGDGDFSQAFRRALLVEAHDKAARDSYRATDDAMLIERLGGRVAMVEGLPQNLKITTPDDLKAARAWVGGGRRA